jgi:hypothetical protein
VPGTQSYRTGLCGASNAACWFCVSFLGSASQRACGYTARVAQLGPDTIGGRGVESGIEASSRQRDVLSQYAAGHFF